MLFFFLVQLAANETAYNSYHEWRRTHRIRGGFMGCWCSLCQRLHDRSLPAQVYTHLYDWLANDTCQPWSVSCPDHN